jgi:ABC-type multidrug transport system fused ATPase/permease subunit
MFTRKVKPEDKLVISWQYVINFIFIQPLVLALRELASLRSQKSSSLVYETSNPRNKHAGELFSETRHTTCENRKDTTFPVFELIVTFYSPSLSRCRIDIYKLVYTLSPIVSRDLITYFDSALRAARSFILQGGVVVREFTYLIFYHRFCMCAWYILVFASSSYFENCPSN